MPSDKPNPGSREAVEQGCICPIIDNHHGRGTPQGFWIAENCPLHGKDQEDAE